jgi:voltage-gated potassium channel
MTAHSPAIKRLRVGLVTLFVLFFVGVVGYQLSGMPLLESVYMVVVTFSTVGNRGIPEDNPPLAVFTILMIVFGVSTTLYIVGVFVQMMLEGEINRAIGQRRVTQDIERLTGHVIVCGYGRTGEILAGELARRKTRFVVVDKDPERINEAAEQGYLALTDDATHEQALINAGIHRAKTVVASLPTDAQNVFITLTARNLEPNLQIIARGELQSTENKLLQAGADRVVLPAMTGAVRMAAMITRPSAVELIELAAGQHMAEVEIDELIIPAESPLVGQTVREFQPRARHGLLIVAVKSAGNPLEFNPDADTAIQAEDAVMVMGRLSDIERFRTEYGL